MHHDFISSKIKVKDSENFHLERSDYPLYRFSHAIGLALYVLPPKIFFLKRIQ